MRIYLVRNAQFNARNFFEDPTQSKNPFSQHEFGGTIGGPILKEKLFFFGAYEGLREQRSAPGGSDVIVETQAFKDWVTSKSPNSIAAKVMASDPPFK